MTACRSCQARVFWVRTSSNRAMLVNESPDPKGNIVVDGVDRATVYRDSAAAVEAGADRSKLYVSHFVTCDRPAEWRGKLGRS